MSGSLFPILLAAVVSLLVFGLVQVGQTLMNDERRKLKQRLVGEDRASAVSNLNRPLVLQQDETGSIALLLRKFSFFGSLQRNLLQAYPDVDFTRFVMLCVSAGAVIFGLSFAYFDTLFASAVAGLVAMYLPVIIVNGKRSKRQRLLADQLPEALDFLSRILKAGHSLSTGLQMMSDELPQPLSGEFRRAYDQHSLGQPLEDSLKDLATRVDSTDFAFFVTAVLIQRQTGGDLSQVLGNISGMIRQRIRLQMHVKAKTAEGRFTGYFLAAFPMIMFVITYCLNPEYAGVLITTGTGRIMSCIAVGLQLCGLVLIRKITTVTV